MAAQQGYNQELYFEDPTTPGTYIDMSCYLTDGTIQINMDPIDTTTFCTDGWAEGIPGIKRASLNIGAIVDSTYRTWQMNAINASQPFGIKHYPEGKDTGKQYYQFDGYLNNGGDGGSVGSALTAQSTISSSGPVTIEVEV